MKLKLLTWNVNGIRSILQKGFTDAVANIQPDVICLQEIKALPEQVNLALPDYQQIWNPAERRGYSGTAIFTKIPPRNSTFGLGRYLSDNEGRVIAAEYENFFLVNVYTPNVKRELTRLDYRFKEWDPQFLKFVRNLAKKKAVIMCGDLNVAHQPIDLAHPKPNEGNAGFTKEEREGFQNLLDGGFHDAFRVGCPDPGRYTWWTYRTNARQKNIGWRIDYFLASDHLHNAKKTCEIHDKILGSDHCPVTLEFDL